MARNDGVKIGAGGKVMLSEVPEEEVKEVKTLAAKQNEKKKVEVLEERLQDLPEEDE